MATLPHGNSRRLCLWWWDSHISPKNSRWLQENLTDMDKNVKAMIKLIEEDADSFRKRAEMYYRKRPELMKLVEEFYRAYRALAERYDHATGALRQAHRTMAEAFPDQIPFLLPDESVSGLSSEMLSLNDADTIKEGFRQMNGMFSTGEEATPADSAEASQLSEENQRLKNQITSESERADKAQADIDSLKGTISKLESEKETDSLQCQLSQERISSLEAELSRAQEEMKKLNDEMLSSINNLKIVEEQRHLLEEGNQRLKNQITFESERADKAQADVESLKGTISELESAKETAFLQCQLSRERISSLEDELSRTQEDMKKLNEEMLSKITNLKSVEEQCHLLEEVNKYLQLELDICKEKAKTNQAELDTRQEELEKLKVSIEEEKQRSVQLEMARQSLEELQSRSQEEVRHLTLEVQNGAEVLKNIELTKAGLEVELQRLKEENAGVKEENLSFSLKVMNLQDEINESKRRLEDELEHHMEENGSLKEENLSASLTITNLQNEISLLKESKRRLEDEVQLLVEENKALQHEIISMKEDKALLELRHSELIEKIGAVNLNVESLQALVKELRDGNVELKEICKMHEDENAVHLDNLKRMEKVAEKNDVLEASLSNANLELEELREKIKTLEESCETLQDNISMYISDKAIMVSQIESIAQNMEMLSEKNTLLENSLSDANVEHEGVRVKLKSLEETCQFLQDNESNLLSEKSTLVIQVESISRSLENSENIHAELECKNMNLEKEKENMLHQVIELQASLKMEKEEHENVLQFNMSQLATLENQILILQEKEWLREEALEAECNKLINAHLENFILRRCLHDMTEKCVILSDKCEKNLETLRCKENFILQLEIESFEQKNSLSALSEDNEKLLEGTNHVLEMLNIDNNGPPSYQHFDIILNEIKDLQASISDAQYEQQHLIIEKSIIVTFLEQSKLDMVNLELEKDGVERDFRVKCEEFSVLLSEKQKQMEINEHLIRDVQVCNQREEGLNAEMTMVCLKLANLQEAHSSLQGEISKLLDENQSLSMKLYDLHDGKETLEEENDVLLQEIMTLEYLCLTFRSYNVEREVNLQMLGNDLDKKIRSMNVKLGALEIENINLKESVADLEDLKQRLVILEYDLNTSRSVCKELKTQIETEKKLVVQKDMELLQATHNFQVLQNKNSESCRNLEQLMVEIDNAKVVRDEFEKKIIALSEDKLDKDNEIVFLRQANGTLCGELDQLHEEVGYLKNREQNLISELLERIDGAKSCEAEITTLLHDSQITTINASIYEEKMLELLLTCESLQISAMVEREKFYEEVTLRNVFEDDLNKKLEVLVSENRVLKEELDVHMPLVLSICDDVASLEACIISPTKRHSLNHQKKQVMMAGRGRGSDGGRGAGAGGGGGRGRSGAGGRGRIQSFRDVTPSSEPDPDSTPSTDASRRRSTTSSRNESGSASGSVPLSDPPADPPADPPMDPPVTAQWTPEYPHTRFHPVIEEYMRGPADPPTAPERPRGEFRRALWPAGTSALGKIIRAKFHGPYLNFSSVPPNLKYVWLDELRTTYWWPPHREYVIRRTYKSAASKKIRDMIYDLKMGQSRPNWIRKDYYEDLLDMMNTPAYKEKSEKANRRTAGLHTGGSRSQAATLVDLTQWAVKEGRAPESVTMYDVFQHTHKRRKDGSFFDERAKETDAAYREALSRAQLTETEDIGETTSAQTPSSLAARNDLFVDIVGGFKKGHLYGVGSLWPLHMATQRFPSTPSPSVAPADDDVRS